MRIQLLFLSLGIFLALVQCSSGAPVESTSSELEEDDDVEKNAAASRLDTVDDESRPMKIDEDDENASSDEHETVLEQKQFNSHSARFHSESDSDSETEENSIDLTGYTNDDNDDQSNDRSDDDE